MPPFSPKAAPCGVDTMRFFVSRRPILMGLNSRRNCVVMSGCLRWRLGRAGSASSVAFARFLRRAGGVTLDRRHGGLRTLERSDSITPRRDSKEPLPPDRGCLGLVKPERHVQRAIHVYRGREVLVRLRLVPR